MWVFLNNSFLSIVAHRTRPDDLLVRARIAGDIEALFPTARVKVTPDADYRFRAVIPRVDVAAAMLVEADCIDYKNFKNSVTDDARHSAYSRVWSVMLAYQNAAAIMAETEDT